MKILNFTAKNFGSYDEIAFDFEEGLTLISGPTGSGKSTFQDIAFWGLFGLTAKGGSVDDVRSWTKPNEATSVKMSVLTPNGLIHVIRIRGKQSENDLFWLEEWDYYQCRGKDIKETQKLLEERLGLSADDYQISSYYHEFSPTSDFFTSSSKNQRALLESVANIDWPVRVAECIHECKKRVKSELFQLEKTLEKQSGKLEQLKESYEDASNRLLQWEEDHINNINNLHKNKQNFDKTKERNVKSQLEHFDAWEADKSVRIIQLQIQISAQGDLPSNNICKECGQPNRKVIEAEYYLKQLTKEQENLINTLNPYKDKLEAAKNQNNWYLINLELEKAKVNPFINQIETITKNLELISNTAEQTKSNVRLKKTTLAHLETLYDYTFELRGQLLKTAVKNVKKTANQYLSDFFDAELNIILDIEGSDSVELNIFKSGHQCNFKQLSKGQRALLNLCFAISVMQAASNRLGLHFDQLFFDEGLSGLDADLKVKSFRLFQHLNKSHTSIYIIDHATEFKSLFDKQYKVEINGDVSSMVMDD